MVAATTVSDRPQHELTGATAEERGDITAALAAASLPRRLMCGFLAGMSESVDSAVIYRGTRSSQLAAPAGNTTPACMPRARPC